MDQRRFLETRLENLSNLKLIARRSQPMEESLRVKRSNRELIIEIERRNDKKTPLIVELSTLRTSLLYRASFSKVVL